MLKITCEICGKTVDGDDIVCKTCFENEQADCHTLSKTVESLEDTIQELTAENEHLKDQMARVLKGLCTDCKGHLTLEEL